MTTPHVRLEVRDAIGYVTLSRPDKHNGLHEPMFRALHAAAKAIRRDRRVRAVILSGEGPSFCAGLDFGALSRNRSFIPRYFLKLPWREANGFQRFAYEWRTLPVPVICVVHGNCFGGGLQLALGADIRVATPDSRWSVMETKWGLIPDMSATTTLATLTRYDIAQELTMTGRIFSGEEAADYGLTTRLSEDPMSEAEAIASAIAERSPDQTAATKLLFRKTWNASPRVALLWERWIQLRLLGRENQRIAMRNGLAKGKEPRAFKDRSLF